MTESLSFSRLQAQKSLLHDQYKKDKSYTKSCGESLSICPPQYSGLKNHLNHFSRRPGRPHLPMTDTSPLYDPDLISHYLRCSYCPDLTVEKS